MKYKKKSFIFSKLFNHVNEEELLNTDSSALCFFHEKMARTYNVFNDIRILFVEYLAEIFHFKQ